VPDGESHQFIGGVFLVRPGDEKLLLDLCDRGAADELCAYLADREQPPELQNREGESLLDCVVQMEVADSARAQAALDEVYKAEDERWVELHALNADERLLRASLALDGNRLTIRANSEARIERVLRTLADVLPDARVVSDTRSPADIGTFLAQQGGSAPELTAEMIEELQEIEERRWLHDHIPALNGLTPFEAVADPTRVEQVERLLATFPDPAAMPEGAFALRPDRLRKALGLPR
jgi:hypothetical protein